MKNIIELLKKRKSIREYLKSPIPRRELLSCIEGARLSPSACNVQPWKFIIVDTRKIKKKLTDEIFKGKFYPNQFAKNAAAIIIVLGKPDKRVTRMAEYIHGPNYYLLDIGIASSNLMLRACELGIGSCMIAWFDKEKTREVLNIPKNETIIALISLGYCKKKQRTPTSRKKIEYISSLTLTKNNKG